MGKVHVNQLIVFGMLLAIFKYFFSFLGFCFLFIPGSFNSILIFLIFSVIIDVKDSKGN